MKKCPECQAEMEESAKFCPKCGKVVANEVKVTSNNKEPKKGLPGWAKALIIIGIIFVLIVGCVNGCTDAVNEAVEETNDSYKDESGKTSFKVNESFQNKNEKITMTEVNTNFTDHSEYSRPTDGYKYVMVKFEVENINPENDELYVSSLDFNADADGIAVDTAYIGNDQYKGLSATLAKGKKSVGYIFYEVPVNAQKITISYNPNFWTDGNAIEFIVQE